VILCDIKVSRSKLALGAKVHGEGGSAWPRSLPREDRVRTGGDVPIFGEPLKMERSQTID